MQQANAGTTITRLREIPDRVFFRIVSSTMAAMGREYRNAYMIAIHDDDLPEELRHHKDESALFVVVGVEPGSGSPINILAVEVDFDIDDETVVERSMPVSTAEYVRNGVRVLYWEDLVPPEELLWLGRIEKGKLKTSATRREKKREKEVPLYH